MRYKIELAYNGSNYAGWQIQPNALTVQEAVDRALSTIANVSIETMGCGRTDAGVHAKYFVAHFNGPGDLPDDLAYRLNKMLASDILIISTAPCNEEFHARFDAVLREYEYHIEATKNPFAPNTCWWYAHPLSLDAMNRCAELLIGRHDFSSFCKGDAPNNNPQCTVFASHWALKPNGYYFTIQANRFLRNMVRAIVGTLVDVGLGKISEAEFAQIFEKKNRNESGHSAPAEGLFLTKVEYPKPQNPQPN